MFTSPAFAQAAGITYRELDYWVRRGVLVPASDASGSGNVRLFDEAELRVALIVGELRKMGASLDLLARVAIVFRWNMGDWRGVVYVGTDGVVRSATCAPCFCIDLDAVLAPLTVSA